MDKENKLKLFGGEDTSTYLCQKHKKRIEDGYRGVEKSERLCH